MAKTAKKSGTPRKKTDAKVSKQINQVRKDLAAVATTLGSVSSETLYSARDKANDMMSNARGRRGFITKVQKKYYNMRERLVKFIHRQPILSVIIALGLGYILARLL